MSSGVSASEMPVGGIAKPQQECTSAFLDVLKGSVPVTPDFLSSAASLPIEELAKMPLDCVKGATAAALIVAVVLKEDMAVKGFVDVISNWSKNLLEKKDDEQMIYAWKQMLSVVLWNDSLPLFNALTTSLTDDDIILGCLGPIPSSSPSSSYSKESTDMKDKKKKSKKKNGGTDDGLHKSVRMMLPCGASWNNAAKMSFVHIATERNSGDCLLEMSKRSEALQKAISEELHSRANSGHELPPSLQQLLLSYGTSTRDVTVDDATDCIDAVNGLFPPPDYHEEEYHYGGCTQRVLALPRQFAQIVIGEIVWRGATALCEWIVGEGVEPPFTVSGSRVAEVGAGCGLCGILCKQLGAERVLITDYEPHVMALIERNAALNGLDPKKNVLAVDWLQPLPSDLEGAFTAVIGSDIIYCRDLCPGLFSTVSHMLVPGGVFAMVNGRARFGKASDLAISEAEAVGLHLVSQTTKDDGWEILSLYRKSS